MLTLPKMPPEAYPIIHSSGPHCPGCGKGNKSILCRRCTNAAKLRRAAYMREYRKTHPISAEEEIAKAYLRVYLKRGKIQRELCEICQSTDAKPYWTDFSKPLDVRWLCDADRLAEDS